MPLIPPPGRLLRRLAIGCALTLGLLLAPAGPAAAHADLRSSSPADGAVVASEPQQVTLVFSEEVTLGLSSVKVIGPDGRRVDSGAPRAAGPGTLTVALAPDPQPGTFVLDWRATAADDGHTTSGALTFSVGSPTHAAATSGLSVSDKVTNAVLQLAEWLGFAGLALLVGCAAIRLHCLPRPGTTADTATDSPPPPSTDPRWPATLGWTVLLAATLVQLFVHGPSTQGASLAHTFDRPLLAATLSTHEGHTLVARIILLAVIAALGEPLLRRAGTRGAITAAVLVLGLAATWSEISHAPSGTRVPLALAVTTLHVAAMAVWAGGLFTIAVLLSQNGSNSPGGTGPDLRATVARFSRLAMGSVAVLAVTGLYQAFREVGSPDALTGTTYGRLLLVKASVFLLVMVVAVGTQARTQARTRARTQARGSRPLRRSVLLELAGVTTVLIVTVLLIGTPPARDAQQPTNAKTAATSLR